MSEWIETEDNPAMYWPYCKVPNCKNRQCLNLNSKYCYPHSMGMEPIEVEERVKELIE